MRKSNDFLPNQSISFKKQFSYLNSCPSAQFIKPYEPLKIKQKQILESQPKNSCESARLLTQFKNQLQNSFNFQNFPKKIVSEGSLSSDSMPNSSTFQGKFLNTSESQKSIKKGGSSSGQQRYLFINQKKQKSNNNYLFTTDIQVLLKNVRQCQISIQKLKQQNINLKKQKELLASQKNINITDLKKQIQLVEQRIRILQSQRQSTNSQPYIINTNNIQTFHNSNVERHLNFKTKQITMIRSPKNQTKQIQNLQNIKGRYFFKKNT